MTKHHHSISFYATVVMLAVNNLVSGQVVQTLAGVSTSSGISDGIGTVARFNAPFAIACDMSCSVAYVVSVAFIALTPWCSTSSIDASTC